MKTIAFAAFLCIIISTTSVAQVNDTIKKFDPTRWEKEGFYPRNMFKDTLHMYFTGISISVSTSDFKMLLTEKAQVNLLIEEFQQHYASDKDKYPSMPRYKLEYYPRFSFIQKSMLDTMPKYYYKNKKGEISQLAFMNECKIEAPWFNIEMKFSKDSFLLDTSLQAKFNKAMSKLSEKQWAKTNDVWFNEFYDSTLKPTYVGKGNDQLVLNLYSGLTFPKNNFSAFAEIRLGYSYNVSNYKREFLLGYDWTYSFANDGSCHINSFLNFVVLEEGFLPHLKIKGGIDCGYLIHRSGDQFEKNTFRLGLGFKGDFFYFSPQIYFPGGFKRVYPGFKFAVGI